MAERYSKRSDCPITEPPAKNPKSDLQSDSFLSGVSVDCLGWRCFLMNWSYPRAQARCQHRTISLFCAIQCWINGWDGIRISRIQLEQMLALKKFKRCRVNWIEQDFSELFPYQRQYGRLSPSFELSRRSFEDDPEIGELETPDQSNPDNINTLSCRFLPPFADGDNNIECMLISYLWLLANGRISPY